MVDRYDVDSAYVNGHADGYDGCINTNCYNSDSETDEWEAYEKGYREGVDAREASR